MTTELKLGSKHECPACSTKFYDLGNAAPVCPSCGADPSVEVDAETKKAAAKSKKKKKKGK